MSKPERDDIIQNKLKELPGWNYQENALIKEFIADNFSSALAFTVQIGIEAEKADHHPDLLIHSWNKILIKITTHEKGGVTERDFNLAESINKLV